MYTYILILLVKCFAEEGVGFYISYYYRPILLLVWIIPRSSIQKSEGYVGYFLPDGDRQKFAESNNSAIAKHSFRFRIQIYSYMLLLLLH